MLLFTDIFTKNELNIDRSRCPAVMLAASLTPKLTIFIKYERVSIKTKNTASNKGDPKGVNWEKKLTPLTLSDVVVIATTTHRDRAIVVWGSAVKEYTQGISPSILESTTNISIGSKINTVPLTFFLRVFGTTTTP